jgi:hypothetical protein
MQFGFLLMVMKKKLLGHHAEYFSRFKAKESPPSSANFWLPFEFNAVSIVFNKAVYGEQDLS